MSWTRALSCCALLASTSLALPAMAQAERYSAGTVKIGVLNDRSGPVSDASGEGSVVAARLAVEEFGGRVNGIPVEVVSADHQNKPDIGSTISRQWYDRDNVDIVVDIANSAVSLALINIAGDRNKIVIHNSGSAEITGKSCHPVSMQWTFNTFANANAFANAIVKEGGRDTWFIMAADFAYGHAASADLRRFVEQYGGKIVGEVRHPVGASDFTSFLLQAQASNAKVIALANSATDLANSIKQAAEFRIGADGKQILVSPTAVNTSEVDALGLEVAQGIQGMSSFEWNRTDATRALAKRFQDKFGKLPTANQAGVYSSVRHYLKAVQAAGTDETGAILTQMRAMPVNDAYAENGRLREDGQMLHDLYVVRVKKPAESKAKGDYFTIAETVPGEQAFQTAAQSACRLLK